METGIEAVLPASLAAGSRSPSRPGQGCACPGGQREHMNSHHTKHTEEHTMTTPNTTDISDTKPATPLADAYGAAWSVWDDDDTCAEDDLQHPTRVALEAAEDAWIQSDEPREYAYSWEDGIDPNCGFIYGYRLIWSTPTEIRDRLISLVTSWIWSNGDTDFGDNYIAIAIPVSVTSPAFDAAEHEPQIRVEFELDSKLEKILSRNIITETGVGCSACHRTIQETQRAWYSEGAGSRFFCDDCADHS